MMTTLLLTAAIAGGVLAAGVAVVTLAAAVWCEIAWRGDRAYIKRETVGWKQ